MIPCIVGIGAYRLKGRANIGNTGKGCGEVTEKAVNLMAIKVGDGQIDTVVTADEISEKLYRITVHIVAEIKVGG